MNKKLMYSISIGLLLLIVTNPGQTEFQSYLHQNKNDDPAGREANFFLFSIYSNVGDYVDSPHDGHTIKYRYLGTLGNFFYIGHENVF
jgi:hypothetical protein